MSARFRKTGTTTQCGWVTHNNLVSEFSRAPAAPGRCLAPARGGSFVPGCSNSRPHIRRNSLKTRNRRRSALRRPKRMNTHARCASGCAVLQCASFRRMRKLASDAALSAPFRPGKPQEWRSYAECRQAACVNLESAHFCVSINHSFDTTAATASTTEYDANAARARPCEAARRDLGPESAAARGVERAGRLRDEPRRGGR